MTADIIDLLNVFFAFNRNQQHYYSLGRRMGQDAGYLNGSIAEIMGFDEPLDT